MNCLRSIVVITTRERKLINVSGILSLALPPEVNLANVLLDGSTSNISISVSTGPRVPGRNQWIFQQVLVREFVFVLFLFLVLTFDFGANSPRPLASSSACFKPSEIQSRPPTVSKEGKSLLKKLSNRFKTADSTLCWTSIWPPRPSEPYKCACRILALFFGPLHVWSLYDSKCAVWPEHTGAACLNVEEVKQLQLLSHTVAPSLNATSMYGSL